MRTVVVDAAEPASEVLEQARGVLEAGGVVGLPTETFYGLAVDVRLPGSLSRLNAIKGKSADSPVLLLAADVAQVRGIAACEGELFERLAGEFWPGPLTLVLPAGGEFAPLFETVAVRVPGLALPRLLAATLESPISGVSANRHGAAPCSVAVEVARVFPDEISLLLDGGAAPGRAPSTILDLCAPAPRILREGELPASALRGFLS